MSQSTVRGGQVGTIYGLAGRVSVLMFRNFLDEAVQGIHACGQDTDILQGFVYLGGRVSNKGASPHVVILQIGVYMVL